LDSQSLLVWLILKKKWKTSLHIFSKILFWFDQKSLMMVSTINIFITSQFLNQMKGMCLKREPVKVHSWFYFSLVGSLYQDCKKNVGVRKTAFFKMPEKRPKILKLENTLTTEFFMLQWDAERYESKKANDFLLNQSFNENHSNSIWPLNIVQEETKRIYDLLTFSCKK